MNTIGDRINTVMKEKSLKQADLAKQAGVSTAAVNKWIKGSTKNLKGDHLISIASFLGVSIVWLINGNDNEQQLPFSKVNLSDLQNLPSQYLDDIEDYILMKIRKYHLSLSLGDQIHEHTKHIER